MLWTYDLQVSSNVLKVSPLYTQRWNGIEAAAKDGGAVAPAQPAADSKQDGPAHCVVGGAHAFILRSIKVTAQYSHPAPNQHRLASST
ncbi:hypothetical protein MSG28_005945 [Choristoneura fumiferana]|uniref:Uncharacterized protein n=1 Tax=Choristoneura fumiferana TaxID=7141 RepID=A0ACC0L249_CHOFU|nr:hypothetical protein MSG28_005945 [Choristoneura fumiferana]